MELSSRGRGEPESGCGRMSGCGDEVSSDGAASDASTSHTLNGTYDHGSKLVVKPLESMAMFPMIFAFLSLHNHHIIIIQSLLENERLLPRPHLLCVFSPPSDCHSSPSYYKEPDCPADSCLALGLACQSPSARCGPSHHLTRTQAPRLYWKRRYGRAVCWPRGGRG